MEANSGSGAERVVAGLGLGHQIEGTAGAAAKDVARPFGVRAPRFHAARYVAAAGAYVKLR